MFLGPHVQLRGDQHTTVLGQPAALLLPLLDSVRRQRILTSYGKLGSLDKREPVRLVLGIAAKEYRFPRIRKPWLRRVTGS